MKDEMDIVERARWDKRYTTGHVPVTLEECAQEIERLRAMIEKLLQDRRDETACRRMIEALTGRDQAASAYRAQIEKINRSTDREIAAALAGREDK